MSYSLTALREHFTRYKLKSMVPATTGVQTNEKQTLTMSTAGGAATGGAFTLTYSGQTTSTIAYNASAATVQAALEALSNIGAGDVTVTGSAAGPWTVEFTGALDQTDVALMTSNAASVTGPGSPYTLTVAELQKGGYVGVVAAANADRKRIVVSSDWLSQARDGGVQTDFPEGAWDNATLFVPSTGEERRIVVNGYTPSIAASDLTDQSLLTTTYTGYAYVERPFATYVAANLSVEKHTKLPVLNSDSRGLLGIHEILNRALSVMVTPSRITLTAVSGQEAYTLAAFPWLTRQDQLIRAVAYESVSGVENLPLGGSNRIRIDGQTVYFVTTGRPTAGDDFYLDVWRPRSSWIKVSGTWADSTAGLVNESDEADVNPNELSLVAYYFACDTLARFGPSGERETWMQEKADAARQAEPFMRWQRERYDDPTDVPVRRSDGLSSVLSGASDLRWPG